MVTTETPLQYIRGLDVTHCEPPTEIPCWESESKEHCRMARFGRLVLYWPTALSEEIDQAAETIRQFDSIVPIPPEVIDEALRYVVFGLILNAPKPWVAPGADNGIGIQWSTEECDLYIDILPDGPSSTTYALTPKGTDCATSHGPLHMANMVEVLSLVAGR